MKNKLLSILRATIPTSVFVAVILVSLAIAIPAVAGPYLTAVGGTGTSTPSGILYGDNGATSHLNTVTIGSNLTFSGGTLSATGGSGSPGGASSTIQYNANGAFAGNTGLEYTGTNVGIGTTSPYGKLSVVGPVVAQYVVATDTAATSTFAGDVAIGSNGSIPNPYLFIGTSTAHVPLYGRVLGDLIDAEYDYNGQSSVNVANSVTGSCASATYFADGNNPTLGGYYGTFSFLNDGWTGSGCSIGAGTAQKPEAVVIANPTGEIDNVIASTSNTGSADFNWFSNTNTQLMKLTNAGNLGIGTTSPAQLLSVGGNIIIGASTAGGTNGTLTYGGVTLTNAVTGTGSMVLNTAPILSGTATIPGITNSTFIRGGAAVGSILTLEGTNSATPTKGTAAIKFLTGATVGVESARVDVATSNWGFGTTTPYGFGVTIASSTNAQLALGDATAGDSLYTLRATGGTFYISTTTASGLATSSAAALTIDTNGNVIADCFKNPGGSCITGGGSGTVTQINTTWPILGGPITTTGTLTFGGLSTSTAAVVGNIPYFSGVNTFANVATTTLTCSGSVSCSTATIIGSSPITISGFGGSGSGDIATSSQETSGQIPFYTSTNGSPALVSGGSSNLTFTGGTNLNTRTVTVNQFITDTGGLTPYIDWRTSGQLLFTGRTSGTSVIVDNSANLLVPSNVGIGTTSPYANLSVVLGSDYASHAASTGFIIASSSAGTATTTLFSVNSAGLASTTSFIDSGALTLSSFTGTQCLHEVSGLVGVTGSDCGSGGSAGTLAQTLALGNDANGIAIADAGTITGTNFVATSTTATSTMQGAFGQGTSLPGTWSNMDYINLTAAYPASVTTGGGYHIDSAVTNTGPALEVRVDAGASAAGRGIVFNQVDANDAQDFILASSSASNTTTLDLQGLPTGKGILKCDFTGGPTGYANGSCLSVDVSKADAQGLFIKDGTGTALNIVNSGSSKLFQIDPAGDSTTTGLSEIDSLSNNQIVETNGAHTLVSAASLSIALGGTNNTSGGTTNGIEYYDGSKLTNSANFTYNASIVGIGTTTPWATLSVSTTSQGSGSLPLFAVASTTNATLLSVLGNGNVGIGTSTPGTTFGIQGVANFVSGALSTIYNGVKVLVELVIPTTTGTTVANSGDIAINTTAASSSVEFNNGTAYSIYPDGFGGLPFASSTLAYMGAYGSAGTTTINLANPPRKTTLESMFCKTDSGTATVAIGTGSASSTLVCTTSGVSNATSVTFGQYANVLIGIGDITGTPNVITVSPQIRQNE